MKWLICSVFDNDTFAIIKLIIVKIHEFPLFAHIWKPYAYILDNSSLTIQLETSLFGVYCNFVFDCVLQFIWLHFYKQTWIKNWEASKKFLTISFKINTIRVHKISWWNGFGLFLCVYIIYSLRLKVCICNSTGRLANEYGPTNGKWIRWPQPLYPPQSEVIIEGIEQKCLYKGIVCCEHWCLLIVAWISLFRFMPGFEMYPAMSNLPLYDLFVCIRLTHI